MARKSKDETEKSSVSMEGLSTSQRAEKFRNLINKKAGDKVAFNLQEENPTSVKFWIPTGSCLLDRIICRGNVSGIPSGKIAELAGLESCVTEDTEVDIEVE